MADGHDAMRAADVACGKLGAEILSLNGRIATLEAQLKAQRALIAAYNKAFDEWKHPTGSLDVWYPRMQTLRQACREARAAAKEIDDE